MAIDCNPVTVTTCNIQFDGPFVVSLVPDDNDSSKVKQIEVVVPRDSMSVMGNPRHYLFLGRMLVGCDDGSQSYDFTMTKDDQGSWGVKSNARPSIDIGFDDFRVNKPCTFNDYFVRVTLPCPKIISFTQHPVPVIFENDDSGHMPLNHVCEYDVDPSNNGIALTSNETGVQCLSAGNTFLFQVGLTRFSHNQKQHAIHFYNDVILQCFPQGSCRRIKDINPNQLFSLDVDCKLGGMIGG